MHWKTLARLKKEKERNEENETCSENGTANKDNSEVMEKASDADHTPAMEGEEVDGGVHMQEEEGQMEVDAPSPAKKDTSVKSCLLYTSPSPRDGV